VDLQCLPDVISEQRFYEPTDRGFEAEIARRIQERGGDPG
jgi:replication-associated recombination protein RarA